jgi:hypothetical protein
MVVVTCDHEVRNRVVTLTNGEPENWPHPQLQFRGLDARGRSPRLSARLEQASAAYDAILRKLTLLYSKACWTWAGAGCIWKAPAIWWD